MANVPGVSPLNARKVAQKYGVNIADTVECIYQPLYEYQTYPAAGQLNFTFFQTPVGQAGNTFADTNMLSAGQIPKGQMQLVTGIQVELYLDPADIYDAADQDVFLRDFYSVMRADAFLEFTIGSKPYLRQGPLGKFPQTHRIIADLALAATAAAATEGASFAQGAGAVFDIVPLQLVSNQNFSVAINFNAVQAIANDAKFGVTLLGYNFRNAQ